MNKGLESSQHVMLTPEIIKEFFLQPLLLRLPIYTTPYYLSSQEYCSIKTPKITVFDIFIADLAE